MKKIDARFDELSAYIWEKFKNKNAAKFQKATDFILIHGKAPRVHIYWSDETQDVEFDLILDKNENPS